MSSSASTAAANATQNEMLLAARAVGLRYVDTTDAGITRHSRGKSFSYRDATGIAVKDEEILARIRSMAIPPAWTEVWICPSPRGHIQATGRDARGRRQYRYHAMWQQARDETKYERTIAFARALPKLRSKVERDLRRRGMPREKVLAAAVRLLETTLIRVGNEEYARTNRSFGLTTLRDRHASITTTGLKLTFRGKSGKQHVVGLQDRRLARVVRACQDLPGQRLFQYLDVEGQPRSIDSDDVNEYLRGAMGNDFSAKDFRTWAGTVLAARALQEINAEAADKPVATKAALKRAVENVASELGNTAAICRRCYIHPAIIDAYMDGSLADQLTRQASELLAADRDSRGGLRDEERHVLRILRRRLASEKRQAGSGRKATPKKVAGQAVARAA